MFSPSKKEEEVQATRGQPAKARLLQGIEQDEKKLSIACESMDTKDLILMGQVLRDLKSVASEFEFYCAGLSANQIGYNVKAFVVKEDGKFVPYINAEILEGAGGLKKGYEQCLSRISKPPTKVSRHKKIKIQYWCPNQMTTVTEWITTRKKAQCIQHEIDHGKGRLV